MRFVLMAAVLLLAIPAFAQDDLIAANLDSWERCVDMSLEDHQALLESGDAEAKLVIVPIDNAFVDCAVQGTLYGSNFQEDVRAEKVNAAHDAIRAKMVEKYGEMYGSTDNYGTYQ